MARIFTNSVSTRWIMPEIFYNVLKGLCYNFYKAWTPILRTLTVRYRKILFTLTNSKPVQERRRNKYLIPKLQLNCVPIWNKSLHKSMIQIVLGTNTAHGNARLYRQRLHPTRDKVQRWIYILCRHESNCNLYLATCLAT